MKLGIIITSACVAISVFFVYSALDKLGLISLGEYIAEQAEIEQEEKRLEQEEQRLELVRRAALSPDQRAKEDLIKQQKDEQEARDSAAAWNQLAGLAGSALELQRLEAERQLSLTKEQRERENALEDKSLDALIGVGKFIAEQTKIEQDEKRRKEKE